MALYRVSLRMKGWSDIAWQFAETVLAKTSGDAVAVAFDHCKAEKNSTAPATLAQCDYSVTAQ